MLSVIDSLQQKWQRATEQDVLLVARRMQDGEIAAEVYKPNSLLTNCPVVATARGTLTRPTPLHQWKNLQVDLSTIKLVDPKTAGRDNNAARLEGFTSTPHLRGI